MGSIISFCYSKRLDSGLIGGVFIKRYNYVGIEEEKRCGTEQSQNKKDGATLVKVRVQIVPDNSFLIQ